MINAVGKLATLFFVADNFLNKYKGFKYIRLLKNVLLTNYYLNMLETERVYHAVFFLFFHFQIFGSFQRKIFPFNIHQSRYS